MAKIRIFVSIAVHFLVFNTVSTSIDFKGVWQLCVIIYLWAIQSTDDVYVWLNSYNKKRKSLISILFEAEHIPLNNNIIQIMIIHLMLATTFKTSQTNTPI